MTPDQAVIVTKNVLIRIAKKLATEYAARLIGSGMPHEQVVLEVDQYGDRLVVWVEDSLKHITLLINVDRSTVN